MKRISKAHLYRVLTKTKKMFTNREQIALYIVKRLGIDYEDRKPVLY